MKTFTLRVQDTTRIERIEGLSSFIGEDDSGSFGILAGHARTITSLVIGLARFRVGEEEWRYLAMPGAVLYFNHNVLTLSTRHFLLDDDYMRISAALREELLAEEDELHRMKESLHQLEDEVLTRLWELGRKHVG